MNRSTPPNPLSPDSSALPRPWTARYDPGVPRDIDIPPVPVFAMLQDAARRFPARPCTIFRDQPISYAAMDALTDRLAAALVADGLQRGERVGILLPNLPQFVLAYYGVLKAGGVVAAINPQYKPRELAYQLRDAGVERLIALDGAADAVALARPATALRQVWLTAPEDAAALAGLLDTGSGTVDPAGGRLLDLLASQPAGAKPGVMVGPEDVAIFQYSGGTTGVPKGAVALHRSLVANALMFRRWLVGLEEGRETTLMAIPMYHVYGMVVGMAVSIQLGAAMILIPNPRDLGDLLGSIERYRASFFPGVPTLYALINTYAETPKYNLRSVTACISGSAPLRKPVQDAFEAITGATLMEGYGLSEAPTATHCNPMRGERRSGSIGLPLPGVDCRIVRLDDPTADAPPGEAGELLIRSPQVMVGYHNRPEETAEALLGGWLHTGDIARMDADGYFYIVDRKKELIKVGGFQVWPSEIEEVLAAHPAVLEAAAAGIPDSIRGEAAKAWVVRKAGAAVTEEELMAWCRAQLADYKVPVAVAFRDALPKSTVGKVLRRVLRDEAAE